MTALILSVLKYFSPVLQKRISFGIVTMLNNGLLLSGSSIRFDHD